MKPAGVIVFLALLTAPTYASDHSIIRGPSEEIAFECSQPRRETMRLRIVNTAGGTIAASNDAGASWRAIGSVVTPALRINRKAYTASMWANESAVAATAVNAIHIKVANNPDSGRGMVFSIVPGAKTVGAAVASSSIHTDMAGGTGIFGGYGPLVNSPVYLDTDGDLTPLQPDYVPADGDVIQIIRLDPELQPLYCTFENKFGGRIFIEYADEPERLIGQVLRPVVGIGRFDGTLYAAPGRLRANHCGVIDISTSPLGKIGGFQIVPREHAGSAEVGYIREQTQWMVVGPADVRDPSWEGTAPLFAGYLLPSYRSDDINGNHDDWMCRALSRLMVQVRYENGRWENMPRICIDPQAETDNADDSERGRKRLWHIQSSLKPYSPLPGDAFIALRGVSHLRIVFPRAVYWPQQAETSATPAN